MSRIANIIRGLFGRKPVHQQKDSMAPRGNGEKSVQPMPENVIQKIPVEAKMMKEVSDMELQTVNATTVQAQSADGNMAETNVSERDGHGTEVQVTTEQTMRSGGTMVHSCYDNRELSWLKFNTRVLEEAEDTSNPFCERLSFASIFQSNLDEFFMVRVGSLYDQMLVSKDIRDNKTNMTCQEQLFAIFEQVKLLTQRKDAAYAELKRGLETQGVEICSYSELEKRDVEFLDSYFEHEVRPLLSPQIIGKKQPFPFLKNKDIYAVVVLEKKNRDKLGIVPCDLDVIPQAEISVLDKEIDFKGETALPPLKRDQRRGFFKETPKEYYMWHGYLCPEETGMHRISLQSHFPGIEAFERNHVENGDLSVATSGNLYIRECKDAEALTRVGMGVRISANGVVNPFSEVVTCKDGWNNAGGTIWLEAGKEYEIYFNHTCIYLDPLEVRLAWTTPSMMEKAMKEAEREAEEADIVLCFAWHQSVNDRLELEENQNELIERVAKKNKNIVVILNNGDAVAMPWRDQVKGILEMWFSGQEGALATVDVLTGDVNPAGRLPVTFPEKLTDLAARDLNHPERYAPSGRISEKDAKHPNTAHFTEGLLNGYRWFDENKNSPMYPFGFGLSYTKFEYNDIGCERAGDDIKVSCQITNTGDCDGEEVAQCYLGRPDLLPDGVQCAPKVLVDFQRVSVKKGETKTVEFLVKDLYLQYYDIKQKDYRKLTGKRELMIGASSRDIRLKQMVEIKES